MGKIYGLDSMEEHMDRYIELSSKEDRMVRGVNSQESYPQSAKCQVVVRVWNVSSCLEVPWLGKKNLRRVENDSEPLRFDAGCSFLSADCHYANGMAICRRRRNNTSRLE